MNDSEDKIYIIWGPSLWQTCKVPKLKFRRFSRKIFVGRLNKNSQRNVEKIKIKSVLTTMAFKIAQSHICKKIKINDSFSKLIVDFLKSRASFINLAKTKCFDGVE